MPDETTTEEAPRKRGRPPRVLGKWTFDNHDHFMATYRRFQTGHNKGDRDMVDAAAELLISLVNESRGK